MRWRDLHWHFDSPDAVLAAFAARDEQLRNYGAALKGHREREAQLLDALRDARGETTEPPEPALTKERIVYRLECEIECWRDRFAQAQAAVAEYLGPVAADRLFGRATNWRRGESPDSTNTTDA